MIQFNLLPDVKKKYIKAKRTKRLITSISTLTATGAIVLVFMLFSIMQFAQKKNINDLTNDIESGIATLNSIEDLNKILTIQNQLVALPGLHESKPETSRIFRYLTQLTPTDVSIRSVIVNFENNTIVLEGGAGSFESINRFTDTLRFAEFSSISVADEDNELNAQDQSNIVEVEKRKAFIDVATEQSRNEETATYKITATFEPEIFDNTRLVDFTIPNTVTTRSTQGKPNISDSDDNPLFNDLGGQE